MWSYLQRFSVAPFRVQILKSTNAWNVISCLSYSWFEILKEGYITENNMEHDTLKTYWNIFIKHDVYL
jgi:hypothetical protein